MGLSRVAVVLSNLVWNVPAVLLLKPVFTILPNRRCGRPTLAAAFTLPGNLTRLGSLANLIVGEIASPGTSNSNSGNIPRPAC